MQYLGEEDRLAKTLERAGEDMSDAIITAVVKQCGLSLGVNIGLLFLPVMGQAISGLMSVMQMIMGKKYEKDTQKIIAATSEDIKRRAESSKREVQTVAQMVYEQELPAARALAMSGQPLDGIFDSVKSAVSSVGKSVSKAAAKLEDQAKKVIKDPKEQLKFLTTYTSPIGLARLGIKYAGNVAVGAAKAVESTNIIGKGDWSAPASHARDHIDENMYTAQRATSALTSAQEGARLTAKHGGEYAARLLEYTGNEGAAEEFRRGSAITQEGAQIATYAAAPIGFYNLGSGRESYLAARAECLKMRTKAFSEIDRQKIAAMNKFKSEAGRAEMRVTIAKAMRQDPAFIAYMQQIEEMERAERAQFETLLAQEQAALNILEQNAQPATTGGAGAAVGIAAAVAAAFALS